MAAVLTVDYGKRVYSIESACKVSMHHRMKTAEVTLAKQHHHTAFKVKSCTISLNESARLSERTRLEASVNKFKAMLAKLPK